MTSARNIKAKEPIKIDPNFFLPPNVVEMSYVDIEDNGDNTTERSAETGNVVGMQYDDEIVELDDLPVEAGAASTVLSPPDGITVVSQNVRVTADGKYVVDVIIDVADVPGVSGYDRSLTKL